MADNNLESKFKTGMLVIVMFLMLVATLHFYFSVQDVIGTWFEYQYASIFRAIFSFAVIVVCIYLIRFHIISRG